MLLKKKENKSEPSLSDIKIEKCMVVAGKMSTSSVMIGKTSGARGHPRMYLKSAALHSADMQAQVACCLLPGSIP